MSGKLFVRVSRKQIGRCKNPLILDFLALANEKGGRAAGAGRALQRGRGDSEYSNVGDSARADSPRAESPLELAKLAGSGRTDS